MGGAELAQRSPPFLSRERAAGSVDADPERRSPRYHETCLALESVRKPRGGMGTVRWLVALARHARSRSSVSSAVHAETAGAFPFW